MPSNSDHCGIAITAPTGSVFTQPTGADKPAVQALILSTTGAISYLSPDFAFENIGNGLQTASLQNQFHVDNPDPTLSNNFVAPIEFAARFAMSEASANFSDTPGAIFNPLNWSAQGVVANPVGEKAYPISGFSWLDFYQCYSNTKFPAILSLLAWYYGDSVVNANYGIIGNFPPGLPLFGMIQSNGFDPIPDNWLTAVIDAILGVDPFNGASTGFGTNGSTCTAFE